MPLNLQVISFFTFFFLHAGTKKIVWGVNDLNYWALEVHIRSQCVFWFAFLMLHFLFLCRLLFLFPLISHLFCFLSLCLSLCLSLSLSSFFALELIFLLFLLRQHFLETFDPKFAFSPSGKVCAIAIWSEVHLPRPISSKWQSPLSVYSRAFNFVILSWTIRALISKSVSWFIKFCIFSILLKKLNHHRRA